MKKFYIDIAFAGLTVMYLLNVNFQQLTVFNYVSFALTTIWLFLVIMKIAIKRV